MLSKPDLRVARQLIFLKDMTGVVEWIDQGYRLTLEQMAVTQDESQWRHLQGQAAVLKHLSESIAKSREIAEALGSSN